MSKKTRKKSPKTAGKPAAKKQASVRSPKADEGARLENRASRPQPSRANARPRTCQKTVIQSIAESAVETVKAGRRQPRNPGLAEGARAPAFRLPRDGGDSVSLADFAGQKLVVFFYPRADTPGCTREAIDFTRLRDAFAQAPARRSSASPPIP